MELPRQDMRLIVPALSALAGAWCAFRGAEWSGLALWSIVGLCSSICLFSASAWIARGRYRAYAIALVVTATAAGVFSVTGAHIISHHRDGVIEKSTSTRATIHGTITSRPEAERMQWSQGKCSVAVAVDDLTLGERSFHYRALSVPILTDIAHQLGYPAHSAMLVNVCSADCSALAGQTITAQGKLSPLPREGKESAQLFVTQMSLEGKGSWVDRRVSDINQALTRILDNRPAHIQGLLLGVALGDDTRVSESLSEAMRMTQMTHLIAVSGGHISILMGIVLSIVGRRKPVLAAAVCLVTLGALVVLVGAQASVMRAFFMSLVILAALARWRSTQSTPAWSTAVIGTAIADPYMALSYGFLLSASATIGIVLVGVPLARHLTDVFDGYTETINTALTRSALRYGNGRRSLFRIVDSVSALLPRLSAPLASGIAIPLTAQIFCLPVLFLFTDESSVWGVLANALVAPVVAPLTVFGLLAALSAPVAPFLASLCIYPAQVCTWWIDYVARTLADFYGSNIPLWLAGLLSLCMLGAAVWIRTKIVAAMLITPVVALVGVQWVAHPHAVFPDEWQVFQCDVGQGAALLSRVENKTVMVDVGPEGGNIRECLTQANVNHIDLLILSHMHDDHVGGLQEVIDTVTVGHIWVSPTTEPADNWATLTRLAGAAHIPVETVSRGQNWGQHVHILSPRAHPSGDPNADSLVVHIDTAGGVLVMGDADGTIQIPIAARVSHVRTIVIAHHGSARQEEALADAVHADIAIISVGENTYGHPSEKALRIYASSDIYDTLTCGAIALTLEGVFSQCEKPVG